MSMNVNDKNLGHATAYAYYKAGGGTMTEAEFTEFMADFGTASQTAVEAAQAALASKNTAQTAATTATNKASEATTAATTATTKAGEASTSASTATSAKDTAVSASQTATTKATEATTAAATATSAKTDAVAANTAAQSAKTAAQTAQTGAETAAASVQSSAEQIATNTEDIAQLKSGLTVLTSDGVVPSAEQMLSDNYTEDSVPYHFRKTASDNADREELEIVGGTVAWNQLVQNGNFADGLTNWGVSTDLNPTVSDGVLTFTPIAKYGNAMAGAKQFIYEHKYILFCELKTGNATNNISIGISDNTNFTYAKLVSTGTDFAPYAYAFNIASSTISNICRVFVRTEANSDFTPISVKDVMLFDLTAMFGSTIADYIYSLEQATAGAGVAFFKSLFPNDYYPYNAGELVSVSGLSEHKMVGFNQWDEEWVNGRWAGNEGVFNPAFSSYLASKNPIHVLPNTTYYFSISNSIMSGREIVYYDASDNWISDAPSMYANGMFTTPSNCHHIRFNLGSAYGTTYNHDICINLSNPAKNGTYEPYKAHSYPLDSTLTLRGMFKLDANNNLYADGDTYDADGTVARKYGIVDLGTLNWSYDSAKAFFYSTAIADALTVNYTSLANCITAKYLTVKGTSYNGGIDKTVSINDIYGDRRVGIKDSAYTDAATFKAAMSGVYLVYELATPTTEEADPYQHLQQCDPSGTEEYVSTGIVPVGHNSFYPENLRAKVEGLPWNFASLIAPTEATFTATRNYTTGSLFIVNNVLYKATSNIANGGTITPNTNCTATTLAEIISALA